MTDQELLDKLQMMSFFCNRAGKELWFDKPTNVQDADIELENKILNECIKRLQRDKESTYLYAVRNTKTQKFVSDLTSQRKKFWQRRGAAVSAICNTYKACKPDLELVTFKIVEVPDED